MTNRVQFYIGDLQPEIAARSPAPCSDVQAKRIIQRDLRRYYALLAWEAPTLTDEELTYVALALRKTDYSVMSARFLPSIVAEAVRSGLVPPEPERQARLAALTVVQALALLDTIEQRVLWPDTRQRAEVGS